MLCHKLAVFAGLTAVNSESRSSVQLNSSLLTDSAFCELETDFVTVKNIKCPEEFRQLPTIDDCSTHRHNWLENLPDINLCYDEYCRLDTGISLQSVVGSYCSDGCKRCEDSSGTEELEVSDTESQGHSTEYDVSSSTSYSLSDKSSAFLVRDGSEQVTDDSTSSDVSHCTSMEVDPSSDASSGNQSQLLQHQPLVFFLIGLFVGLSLGFFTCEYAADAVRAALLI